MRFLTATSILSFLVIIAVAQTPDPNFELYILAGQSNMAGRGIVTDSLKIEGNDSVFMLTKDLHWLKAHHPLHFDKTSAGVGPGLAFGIAMATAHPGKRIGLIPCAVGGTSIERWLPGAFDSATGTHPYDDAAARISFAMRYGTINGIIWHQGEANSAPGQAAKYLLQLTDLINRFRTLTNNPQLPFVAGELGRFLATSANINQQLELLPRIVAHTAVVSSEGLTDKGDQLHFNAASANELGKRYGALMKSIAY